MSVRELAPPQLPHAVPPLVAGRSVILLATDAPAAAWSARVAWAVARAAHGERPVALIDASVEEPGLDVGAVRTAPDGLVDAFEFGASLTHVAIEQETGLHYVPVGTPPSDPAAIWASDRWERLRRGFASQDALMLIYVPREAIPHLAFAPDGIVMIARGGVSLESLPAPTLAVIREELGVPPRESPLPRRSVPPWARWTAAAFSLVVVVAAAVVLAGHDDPQPADRSAPPPTPPASVSDDRTPPPEPVPADPVDHESPVPAGEPGDTLFFGVQVAAFPRLGSAQALGDRLTRMGHTVVLTPIRLEDDGRVWYRVVAGVLPSAGAAMTLRAALRSTGVLQPRHGTIQRTPLAFEVGRYRSGGEATDSLRGLRQRRIPAYIVPVPNGTVRLLVGAFTQEAQARTADSILKSAGLHASLVSRTGIAR
ncbi:MAG TPA: SPOR domain-containing protein [Gemmatimonadales bacterium]